MTATDPADRRARYRRLAEAAQARCQLHEHVMLRAAEQRGDTLLPHLARWLQDYSPDRREVDEPFTFS